MTNGGNFELEFTREELNTLWMACGDACDGANEEIQGRPVQTVEERDVLKEYVGSVRGLEERFSSILITSTGREVQDD